MHVESRQPDRLRRADIDEVVVQEDDVLGRYSKLVHNVVEGFPVWLHEPGLMRQEYRVESRTEPEPRDPVPVERVRIAKARHRPPGPGLPRELERPFEQPLREHLELLEESLWPHLQAPVADKPDGKVLRSALPRLKAPHPGRKEPALHGHVVVLGPSEPS